ncbi:branched-chain amino acid ABC transporter permease [Actinomadura sp. NBRC 104412]|uniref:branched-chain amino acid ABC transporter permease n=1 Tax=Actinomadura sp. NBRC 104412 TaxID=3032203 RepID=UPI0024A0FBAC|nr:branched-chain amino acid ABC transporter permease [Actinomadura sp. NBRC 104412]GLZ02605.1 branched-chain amino acid ABC transporter permease [Actinomadura sp. NBRC 104412]
MTTLTGAAARPASGHPDAPRPVTTLVTPSRVATVLVLVALALLPQFSGDFTISNFSMVLIYGLAILSLDVVTGYAGQISLGHGGLMGVGAYSTALLVTNAGVNPYLAILLAPLAAAVLGLVFAVSALRLSGMYLALATFALALTVPQFAKHFEDLTGGTQGMTVSGWSAPSSSMDTGVWTYYVILVAATLAFGLTRLFLGGRVGRALGSVRDSELAATVCGINVSRVKIAAFFVSSLLAGLAGALLALFSAYVSPDPFAFTLSLTLFIGLGVTGVRSPATPLIGGIIIVYLPLVSGEIYQGKPDIAYGAIIVLLVLLGRGGLIDIAKRLFTQARRVAAGSGPRRPDVAEPQPEQG